MIKDKKKGFIKPSIEDIDVYCKEKEISIEAERFIDFYESKGWLIGKAKMKDWKATVRNWARRNKETDTRKPKDVELDWLEEAINNIPD